MAETDDECLIRFLRHPSSAERDSALIRGETLFQLKTAALWGCRQTEALSKAKMCRMCMRTRFPIHSRTQRRIPVFRERYNLKKGLFDSIELLQAACRNLSSAISEMNSGMMMYNPPPLKPPRNLDMNM
jgi:hypothetical protein